MGGMFSVYSTHKREVRLLRLHQHPGAAHMTLCHEAKAELMFPGLSSLEYSR